MRVALAGIVTCAAGPIATTRPLLTSRVALSIGADAVPSMTRAPVNAFTGAVVCAGRRTDRPTVAISIQALQWMNFMLTI